MNSLGFDKAPKDTRVVVAMSGGVDSSVAAALLREEGYDVVGITLQLYDHGEATAKVCTTTPEKVVRTKTCCAGQDIYDARRVAEKINIPHYVLNYESIFRESVMEEFADSYLKGETPIPCVRCNSRVKFRDLLTTARDLKADALATGHYVRREQNASRAELHMAQDPTRDQSYFLFSTTQDQLDFLRFPLGGMPKSETRALAARFNLPTAEKPDSQDICFVPNGRYADVVKKLRPGALTPGDIVDEAGEVLGRHEGIIHFTVGQRRGLNIQTRAGENRAPLFVLALDAEKNRVIVGPQEALAVQTMRLREVNWLGGNTDAQNIQIKFRSTMAPIDAEVKILRAQDGTMHTADIHFAEAQMGVSPGQACVFYEGSRVLGGGWIERTAGSTSP
jgi:tRNA-specific 2-thiouridylase